MKKAYKREEKGRNLHKFVVKSSIDVILKRPGATK